MQLSQPATLESGEPAKCSVETVTERLRIGELAARSGVTRDTIRFYERTGLLSLPDRSPSRHRVYDASTLDQIKFVRQLQNCGLTIRDIRELVALGTGDGSADSSRKLMEIFRARLVFIEERIAELEGCRVRLMEAMQLAAKARAKGYAALAKLPDPGNAPVFKFGKRAENSGD